MELTDLSPTTPGALARAEGQLRRWRSSAIAPGRLTGRPPFERACFLIAPIGEERGEVRKRSDLVHEHIVSPAAEELGLVAVRADQLPTPGRITRQIIDPLPAAVEPGIEPGMRLEAIRPERRHKQHP